MNKKELIQLIETLKIDKEEFWVLSSGALVLRDIYEEAKDLDLGVSEKGLQQLQSNHDLKQKENGWYIVNDLVECCLDTRNVEKIGNYYVESIDRYYKYLLSSNREKDKLRIPLIEKYMKSGGKMLELRKVNYEDLEEEYMAISSIQSEKGFENEYYGISKEEFKNTVIPKLLDQSEGKNLKPGRVPSTYFFLWDNDKIVGIFKIRHCLNEVLAKGSGHIGYGILPKYRGMGYASKGLKLAIEICEELIKEDEIYMSVYKDNTASLKVQQKNGAYIVSETEDHYLTRIKLNRKKDYSNKR